MDIASLSIAQSTINVASDVQVAVLGRPGIQYHRDA